MFHLFANTILLGTTADTDVTALSDDIIQIQNSHFILPRDMDLIAAWAGSATLNRARLNSPSLRQISQPFIRPINVAALPADNPNVADYRENPFKLRGQEELAVEATSDIAMGTERFTSLLWIRDRAVPAPIGDVVTIRATSTTACVANTWTSIALTFTQSLPVGTYAVVGAEHFSTNGQAFRFIFDDQYWRPGGLSINALARRTHRMFYKGGLGVWGRFRTISLPRCQVLANGTDNAHTIYLDVVRVGF